MTRRIIIFTAVVVLAAVSGPTAYPFSIQDIVDQVSQSSYQKIIYSKLYARTGCNRGWDGREHDLARDNIYTLFDSYGLETSLDPFIVNQGGTPTTFYNVVAVQPGTVRPDDIYVIGAHYDSVGNPGADDNASGVAGVLEAARVLSQYNFEATLIYIAFDREEDGCLGSYAYVNEHRYDNILGMVSLDMIAHTDPDSSRHTACITGLPSAYGFMQGYRNCLSLYGGLSSIMYYGVPFTDCEPFQYAGFNACHLGESSYNEYYHHIKDSLDTPGYIDYIYATNMTRSTVGFFATSAGLASVPEPGSLFAAGSGFVWLVVVLRRRMQRKS